MIKDLRIFIVILSIFFLSACGNETARYVPGDIQKDFCGTHLNYQYCECAFRNEFCKDIAMGSDSAKEHVNGEYAKWVEKGRLAFNEQCMKDNGFIKEDECNYCDLGKFAKDGKCVREKRLGKNDDGSKMSDIKRCSSDNDCLQYCEGNLLKSSRCDLEKRICGEMTEKNCALDLEAFGEMVFPMVCKGNACQRDEGAISTKREELAGELAKYESHVNENERQNLYRIIEIQAGKYCNDASAATTEDRTKFANQVASSTAGISDKRLDVMADYVKNMSNELDPPNAEDFGAASCQVQSFFNEKMISPIAEDGVTKSKELEAAIDLLPQS